MSDQLQQIFEGITTYSKTVILVMLVLTVAVGAGIPMVDQDSDTGQFESDSPAIAVQEYIDANFTVVVPADEPDERLPSGTIVQAIQRADEGGNALSRDSLIASLEFQKTLVQTESVRQTLVADNPFFGIANVLANAQLDRDRGEQEPDESDTPVPVGQESGETDEPVPAGQESDAAGEPVPASQESGETELEERITTIEAQQDALASLSDAELEALIGATLTEDAGAAVLSLLPESYEPGTPHAAAQSLVINQGVGANTFGGPVAASNAITDAQLEIRTLALDEDRRYSVFGSAIIGDEIDRSLGDSFAIVGPLALLFVVLALTVAYRDLLDILLGVSGVICVLVWLFGFMGWTGIAFNQLLISVPVLLIGLSIDYAIHVFMRHREQRAGNGRPDLRGSMALALAGVGVALLWVTVTAAIGFLANLISPIGPLQDFAIVAAFGVFAALLIFAVLVPALKVELDGMLEGVGIDRRKRAFGTGGTRFSRALASGAGAARRFPFAVVLLALLFTLGGVYGATQVETSFQEEDFLADSPPAWAQHLPEPFAPGTYQVKSDLAFIQANFQPEGSQADILLREDVTDDRALQWIQAGTDALDEAETVFTLPTGEPDVQTPLSMMRETAAVDDEFDAAFEAADTTGDGIPDENVAELYDQLLAVNPTAAAVIHWNDAGEYEALRIVVEIRGDASTTEAADDLRSVADGIEDDSGGALLAQPTGDQIIFDDIETELLNTVVQGLIITLVAVFLFMAVAYSLTGNPASLGVVTMIPVLLSVTWILGSMWLLDIPFNVLTGTITSLTIGLGIAYSIHISARYQLELRRQGDIWDALHTTLTGTGGALLGSAATTVGAFGTLSLAILPVLKQFGIITGLTIIYAFLASVLVLPSLLVLWTRYFGPSGHFPPHEGEDESEAGEQATVATD